MWEVISNELIKKYGTFHSPLQNTEYKNMLKKKEMLQRKIIKIRKM